MALSENKTIGWKKWILLLWAVFEIVLLSGVVFGWGVLVFVLKDEGLYSDLCQMAHTQDNNTRNESTDHSHATIEPNGTLSVLPTSASTSTSEVTIDGVCKPQDEKMALCFTIASALFCVTAPFIGHISYKFGTRVYRLIAL